MKELQDILDKAKGQPGLARTRKSVSKMLKRVKAELVSVSASLFLGNGQKREHPVLFWPKTDVPENNTRVAAKSVGRICWPTLTISRFWPKATGYSR